MTSTGQAGDSNDFIVRMCIMESNTGYPGSLRFATPISDRVRFLIATPRLLFATVTPDGQHANTTRRAALRSGAR
jgi:hypothetical protein